MNSKIHNLLIFCLSVFFLFFGCKKDPVNSVIQTPTDYTRLYNMPELFYTRNKTNFESGNNFIVIRLKTRLFLSPVNPDLTNNADSIELRFGDILTVANPSLSTPYYLHMRDINGITGWVYSGAGIALNANEDENLTYFTEELYPKLYKDTNGNPGDSAFVILVKNFVPLLIEDCTTNGWFYPPDKELGLALSEYAVSIAGDIDTFFYSVAAYDWRVNELVISYNLLSDAYLALDNYDKAAEIQEMLIRRHFWKRADNTQTGGINSNLKLVRIFAKALTNSTHNSIQYLEYRRKIIRAVLNIGDEYAVWTLWDIQWHKTGGERALDILYNSVSKDIFYEICDLLIEQTQSEGYRDMILLYKGVDMYKNGQKDEAIEIFVGIKRRNSQLWPLKIKEWLAEQKIVPDNVLNSME